MSNGLFNIDLEVDKCSDNIVTSPSVGVFNIELEDICDDETGGSTGVTQTFDCVMYSGCYSTTALNVFKTFAVESSHGLYQTTELKIVTYINLPADFIYSGAAASCSLTTDSKFSSTLHHGAYSTTSKLKIYPQFSSNHSFGNYSYNRMLISFSANHSFGSYCNTNTIAISGISFDPADMFFGMDCTSQIPTLFKTTFYSGLEQSQYLKTDRLLKPVGYYHGLNSSVYKAYTTPGTINLYPDNHLLGFISTIYSEDTEVLEVCNLNKAIFYKDGTELSFNKTSKVGCGDKTGGCSLSITDHSYKSEQSFGLSSYSTLNGVLNSNHYTNSCTSYSKLTTSDLIRLCGVQPDYNTSNVYLEVTDVVLCPHKLTNEFGSYSETTLSTTQLLGNIDWYSGLYSYRTNLERDLVFGHHWFGSYSTSSLYTSTNYKVTHNLGHGSSTYTLSIEAAVFKHGFYTESTLTKYKKEYDICLDYVEDLGQDNSANWVVNEDPDADKFIPTGLVEDPSAWPLIRGKIIEVTTGDKVFIDFSTI